jgi:hypothetical protein
MEEQSGREGWRLFLCRFTSNMCGVINKKYELNNKKQSKGIWKLIHTVLELHPVVWEDSNHTQHTA